MVVICLETRIKEQELSSRLQGSLGYFLAKLEKQEKSTLKHFLYFLRNKFYYILKNKLKKLKKHLLPKKFLIFSQKKILFREMELSELEKKINSKKSSYIFIYFRKKHFVGLRLKQFLYLLKRSFSYISGNGTF